MKANNILETIGNTPHVRINRLFAERNVEVWMKLERANPGGSIKDRIGLAMIEDAERRGLLKSDTVIIEPTSGNTGISLAMAAKLKGYRIVEPRITRQLVLAHHPAQPMSAAAVKLVEMMREELTSSARGLQTRLVG